MKNKSKQQVFLLFFFFTIFSYGQDIKDKVPFEPYTDNAEIEIQLNGTSPGKAKLYGIYGNQNILKDSALVDSTGKVVFKNPSRYPSGLYYGLFSDNTVVTFLLDKNQRIFLHTDKFDLINSMKTISAENELYFRNQIYEANLNKRQAELSINMASSQIGSKEYENLKEEQKRLIEEKLTTVKDLYNKYPKSFFTKFKLMGQNPKLQEPKKLNGDLDTAKQVIIYRNEFWNNYDFDDDRLLRTPVFYNKLNTYLTTLFIQRADSILVGIKYILDKVDKGHKELFNFTVNYILLNYRESKVMGGEKIFCYTVDNYFTLKKAYWTDSVNVIRAKQQSDLMKPSLLGAIGQDLNCKNEQGVYVSLYSIKKPIRIVYLFNPDCEHCQKETPKLKALYDKWKTKGLEVYALNVERDYDKWHNYIKTLGLDWINVIDPKYESLYYKKYHIFNTPGIYVLDASNKIVAKQLMPEYLEQIFETMVK